MSKENMKEIINQDKKVFPVGDIEIAVAQINTVQIQELADRKEEIKRNILNKDSKMSIFSQFSEFISLIYQTKKTKFSKLKILEIIAKHKKYITEFRNSKSK